MYLLFVEHRDTLLGMIDLNSREFTLLLLLDPLLKHLLVELQVVHVGTHVLFLGSTLVVVEVKPLVLSNLWVFRSEFFVCQVCLSVSEEMEVVLELTHQLIHLLAGQLISVLVESTTSRSWLVQEILPSGNHITDSLLNYRPVDIFLGEDELEHVFQHHFGLDQEVLESEEKDGDI